MFKVNLFFSLVCLVSLQMFGASSSTGQGAMRSMREMRAAQGAKPVDIASVDLPKASDDELNRMLFCLGVVCSYSGQDTTQYDRKWSKEGDENQDALLQEVTKRFKRDSSSPVVRTLLENGRFVPVQKLVSSLPDDSYKEEVASGYSSGSILHYVLGNSGLNMSQKGQLVAALCAKDHQLLAREDSDGNLPFEKLLSHLLSDSVLRARSKGYEEVLELLKPEKMPVEGSLKGRRRACALEHHGMPLELYQVKDAPIEDIMQKIVVLDEQHGVHVLKYMQRLFGRKDELTQEVKDRALLHAIDHSAGSAILKELDDMGANVWVSHDVVEGHRFPILELLKRASVLASDDLFELVSWNCRKMLRNRGIHKLSEYVENHTELCREHTLADRPDILESLRQDLESIIHECYQQRGSVEKTRAQITKAIESFATIPILLKEYEKLQVYAETCYQKTKHQYGQGSHPQQIVDSMIQHLEHTYQGEQRAQLILCKRINTLVRHLLILSGQEVPEASEELKNTIFHLCLKHDNPLYVEAARRFEGFSVLQGLYLYESCASLRSGFTSGLILMTLERVGDSFAKKNPMMPCFNSETHSFDMIESPSAEDFNKCLQTSDSFYNCLSPEYQEVAIKLRDRMIDSIADQDSTASSSSSTSAASSSSAAP